ncbi:MAG TPA: M1 family aminopeptidase [Nitrospira sp.]
MGLGTRGLTLAPALLLFFSGSSVLWITAPADAAASGATIRHHDLVVQIDPDHHQLLATDRMQVEFQPSQDKLIFSLAPTLHLDRLVVSVGIGGSDEQVRDLPFSVEQDADQGRQIAVGRAHLPSEGATITAHYHGPINDPPKEPRHLRFVTPSETAGHIGPEGVYISSESQWYPDLPGSLSSYRLRLVLPPDWTGVTQGKPHASGPCPSDLCPQGDRRLMEWDVAQPSEALTLVANRFVAKTREWSAKSGQAIQLAAYLFPEDAQLADEYLEATARYLDAYIPLLGPYPFDSFAVVENFFASGLGMPSFTLLGSGIIKRHYVQPYALGHEIVHSWLGNAVFNQTDRGNWVEGLTTYLANYYWHELSGDSKQAGDQRRLMLRGYNLHVPPARDYPVGQFTRKYDERDNAIGYQKTAMVFHLLRQEIGEEAFWQGLKRLVAEYRGRHAEWADLERVYAESSGRDLRWFFAQWIEQDGAPALSIRSAAARAAGTEFLLQADLSQTGKPYRLSVPLVVHLDGGRQQTIQVELRGSHETVTARLPARPELIEIDPDAMVLHRMPRQALPPVLNHYVTDPQRSLVLAFTDSSDHPHPFRQIVKRIEARDGGKLAEDRTNVVPFAGGTLLPGEGSVLVLGSPASRSAIQSLLNPHCGELVQLRDEGLTLAGASHDGPGFVALVSCHRLDRPGSVVTLLYAVTPQAATAVARLLFFYGWNSYVVFKDGRAVDRGEWPNVYDRMEVSVDVEDVVR